MKKDFQFPAMKRFQFPAIINYTFLICTYLLLESSLNRPSSSSLSASRSLPAAFTRIFDAVESRFPALCRVPAAITLPFDGIRLKSTNRRTHCRSAFGHDDKGAH